MINLWHVFRRYSIKAKLTILFALLFCIFCSSVALIMEYNYEGNISKLEQQIVDNRLEKLHAIIDNRSDYLDVIRQDLEWGSLYTDSPVLYTRILNSSGQTLLESDGMSGIAPLQLFTPQPEHSRGKGPGVIQAENGRSYLLINDNEWLYVTGKELTIQLALDISTETAIDAANHSRMIQVLVVGTLAALLFGGMAIARLLRPLEEIAAYSSQISAGSGRQLIDSDLWPTEFRQFTATYNAMLDRLDQSYTRLFVSTTNMAHELKTPLTAIIGEVEVALMRDRTPDEYRQVLDSVTEESLRLTRIIDNVLFVARAGNPESRIALLPFDPIEGIRVVCEFYDAMVEERNGSVTWHGEGELVGDPNLFRRAVSNLLVNAVTYAQDGVKISLTVRMVEGRCTEVVIRDTGDGIAAEDLDLIFDRFYRNDLAHSNYSHGSGLGLSVVKAIMQLHGGTIEVESTPGQGSVFTLRFPYHQEGNQYASLDY